MQVDTTSRPRPLPIEWPTTPPMAPTLGYDGFFTAETAHDPFIPLALAPRRRRPGLTLGTAIAVAFPRSPMVTAQVAWDLAAMSRSVHPRTRHPGQAAHRPPIRVEWTTATAAAGLHRCPAGHLDARSRPGEPLRFESDEYRFSLLTPFFNPGPIDHP
jgi:hypothetical protein